MVPSTGLHVNSATAFSGIQLTNTYNGSTGSLGFYIVPSPGGNFINNSTGNAGVILPLDGKDLYIGRTTANNASLVVQGATGFVGIGTAAPAIKFQVVNTGYGGDAGYVSAGINLYTTYSSYQPVVSFRLGWYSDRWDIGGMRGPSTEFQAINFYYNGTSKFQVDINGNISAPGTKGFDIQHPLYSIDTNKRLYHAAIEGPRADLIYRGVTVLVNGFATVNIDRECTYLPECAMTQGTFWALCVNPQVFLQNNDSFDRVIGTIENGVIRITCENPLSNAKINWMVIGERHDKDVNISGRTNDDGFLITEYTMPH
jgi:hypothetical protein